MYIQRMKTKRTKADEPLVVGESPGVEPPVDLSAMVRTQIYLTPAEHRFLMSEASRTGETMAGMIRSYIDEKMKLPDDVWTNNPLFEPTPEDPTFEGHEDASLNLDHYVYGAPKRYEKVRGKWVLIRRAK